MKKEILKVVVIYNKLNLISRLAIKLIRLGGWLFEKTGGKRLK